MFSLNSRSFLFFAGLTVLVAAPQDPRNASGPDKPKAFAKAFAGVPKVVVNPSRDQIMPFVYDGNGWTTRFMLANLDNHSIVVKVQFWAQDGSNLSLPVDGIGNTTAVEVTLPPGGNYSFVTSGFAPDQTTGYAYVSSNNGSDYFGGYAIARNRTSRQPDIEMTVPLTPVDENIFTLAFDNTGGYTTYAVLINSSGTFKANINVSVQDSQGNVLATDQILVDPYGRYAFNLADYYPVDGLVGNVYFSSTGQQYVAGSGLRAGPNQSLTIIPTLSLAR